MELGDAEEVADDATRSMKELDEELELGVKANVICACTSTKMTGN